MSVGCLTSYNLLPPGLHPLRAQHLPYIHIFYSPFSFREPSRATPCFTGTAFARFPPTSVYFTLLCTSPPICLNRSSHGVCSHISTHSKGRTFFIFFFFFPVAYFHDDMAQLLLPSRSAMAAHDLAGQPVLVDYPELHLAHRILPLSYSYYVTTILRLLSH